MSNRDYEYRKETKSSSSSGGGSGSTRLSSGHLYQPMMQTRSTVVQRTSAAAPSIGGGGYGSRQMSMRMSYGSTPHFTPGVLEKMSYEGVSNIKGTREKEKHEMQDLNQRFAGYIEKVRYLEAMNKKLDAENKNLRDNQTDFGPIKEMYEKELAQARNVLDQVTKDKAETDSKMVGVQDELEHEQLMHSQTEKDKNDYRLRSEKFNNQLGEFEGEIAALRRKLDMADTDNQKLKDSLRRARDELTKCRKDLDNETCAHIQEANRAQTLEEEMSFNTAVANAEIEELKKMLEGTQKQDMQQFWKTELQGAIREMQNEYDHQLDVARSDMETRFESQIRDLSAGVNRDNLEAVQTKEENRKLKSGFQGSKNALASLESKVSGLEMQVRDLLRQLDEKSREMDELEQKYAREREEHAHELDGVQKTITDLVNAKLSLEMEIATYRKLLDCEEQNISMIIDRSSGVQSRGGGALSDIVQSSSFGQSSGSPIGYRAESTSGATIHRSARGAIAFHECNQDGKWVAITNGNKARGRSQNMKGWRIERECKQSPRVEYIFGDFVLQSEETVKIFGKKNSSEAAGNDLVMDSPSWNSEGGKYTLFDDTGNEKANLTIRYTS